VTAADIRMLVLTIEGRGARDVAKRARDTGPDLPQCNRPTVIWLADFLVARPRALDCVKNDALIVGRELARPGFRLDIDDLSQIAPLSLRLLFRSRAFFARSTDRRTSLVFRN
jgi:hypothetical protein